MATYNGDLWVSEQIVSVLNQTGVRVKLLIRDDASNDGTPQIIGGMAKIDERIKVIFSDVSSGSAGLNFLELITCANLNDIDFIAYCDQDDVWFSDRLINGIQKIRDGNFHGYSSAVEAFWMDGRNKTLLQNPNITSFDFIFEGAGQGCSFIIPILKFKPFQKFCKLNKPLVSKFYYHDWLTYLYIRGTSGKWYFDHHASLLYRQHNNNDTGARDGFTSAIMRLSLIKCGWYRQQVAIALELSKLLCVNNSEIIKFAEFFSHPDSFIKRLYLFRILFSRSRRRFMDRLVLAITALFGWI